MTLSFYRESTGSLGASGHRRQQGVVVGLAWVAERMSHMGTGTEGSRLSPVASLLPYVASPWKDGRVRVKESHCPGCGALGTTVLVRTQRLGEPGSLESFQKRSLAWVLKNKHLCKER